MIPGGRALAGSALLIVLVGAFAMADGFLVERFRVATTPLRLGSGPLDSALGEGRVVHLSDLHLRGFGLRERRLLGAIRLERPDLVVMTGDYADTPAGISALRTLVASMEAPLGIWAVPGNNDYFRGRQEEILGALREGGARVLRNESAILEGRGGRLAIAGVDDPFFGRDDVVKALRDVPPGTPTILLAHSPAVLESRSEAMLFNAGEPSGAFGRGWFWTRGSHLREPLPAIRFERDGRHRLRIQRREDGAGIDTVLLAEVPAGEGRPGPPHPPRRGESPPARGPLDVEIRLCEAAPAARGAWHREEGAGGECLFRDGRDLGSLSPFPLADPPDAVDVEFEAPAGVAYQVWVRLHSPTRTGRSDSIYLQFGDATGPEGEPRYRIGSSIAPASAPGLELVLAGHMHGGQVRIPFVGPLERTIARGPFVMGRYDVAGIMLYVSRGLGTSYLPLRFACAPEMVVILPRGTEART